MPPRLAYISISGSPEAEEAVAVAAVRIPAAERPFPYAVGHSHNVTHDTQPVAIEPDIRLDPEGHVSADEAEAFVRRLHEAAGSPELDVTLFMTEGPARSFTLGR